MTLNEPVSNERFRLASVLIKDSDQPAHARSLTKAFDELSMGSQSSNVPSGEKLRL